VSNNNMKKPLKCEREERRDPYFEVSGFEISRVPESKYHIIFEKGKNKSGYYISGFLDSQSRDFKIQTSNTNKSQNCEKEKNIGKHFGISSFWVSGFQNSTTSHHNSQILKR
jgi:hypothetical protein